ncbi:MAG: CAP domain-containing protein, partial [Clostridiales bacterium]
NRWLEGAGGSNGVNSPITYPQQQGQAGVNAYAQAVVNLVNQERAKGNLPALALDQSLMQAAQIRVTEIMESFSHTRPDGSACFTVLQQVGARYSKAGENIAIGQSSPEDVVKAWMASPGHRANIMSAEYGRIGVGAAASQNSKYSGYAWTQFFAD